MPKAETLTEKFYVSQGTAVKQIAASQKEPALVQITLKNLEKISILDYMALATALEKIEKTLSKSQHLEDISVVNLKGSPKITIWLKSGQHVLDIQNYLSRQLSNLGLFNEKPPQEHGIK